METARRREKILEEREDMFIKDGKTSIEVLNRTSELKAKATKKSVIAEQEYSDEMINLSYIRTKPRGIERAKEIETNVKNFINGGREEVKERQNFSKWFFDMGLVIAIDLYTGRFEIGMGTVEEKVLVELDMTLEDAAMFMKDGTTFVDPEGNPLTIDDIKKVTA